MNANFVALLALLLSACSVVYGREHYQCSTDADCVTAGAETLTCQNRVCVAPSATAQQAAQFEAEWGCTKQPPREPQPGLTYPYRIKATDNGTNDGIPGVRMRLCRGLDPGCSFDTNNPSTSKVTDDTGVVTFDIADGFNGFILMEGDERIPSIVMIADSKFSTGDNSVPLYKTIDIALLAGLIGASWDANRSTNSFLVLDCSNRPAANVRAILDRTDANSFEYYLVNGLPTGGTVATTANGIGGFINVPSGISTFTWIATAYDDVHLGKTTVFGRAGWITFVGFQPNKQTESPQ